MLSSIRYQNPTYPFPVIIERSLLRRVVASEVVQGQVEFVTESGVVSVVATCQRVVELEECSGVRCRDLPESGGATQNPLQRVE